MLWNPGGRQPQIRPEQLKAQTDLLEGLCATIIANAQIEYDDIVRNEAFRQKIEALAQDVITQYEQTQNGFYDFPPQSVQLRCFGSLASGFATKAADMDLGLLSPLSKVQPDAPGSPIPRLIEKAFLEVGLAARLLSKTRVPIIKVCEKPPKSLYDDLVEEHLRQEKGMADNGEEEEENDKPEHEVAEDVDDEADEPAGSATSAADKQQQNQQKEQKDDMQRQSNNLPDNGEEKTDDNRTKKQGWKIFQSRNQTLNSYYGAAKGYLRSVGGRDLTNSGIHSFSPRDYEKLNQVCLTFVEGLEDHQLRDRLFSYKSLNRYDLEYRPDLPRTLQGVFTQVEGEQMVMMWESRQITEKDADKEARGQTCVHRWKTLQDHPNPGFDPLQYDRDLKRAADQLRLLPSIQVMLLSQQQHESTAQYCARAEKLIVDLVGDNPTDGREKIILISQKYVDGIRDEGIREAVREFAENFGYADFQGIAKRHMSYQLAHDLEVCLGKNLYPKYTEDQIRSYIAFLRGTIVRSPVEPFECNFEAPLSPDLIETISQIREVGDPSAMGPNQPRDPYRDRFEFPKSGVGIQCDINFSAHLAMHNTHLLRCYSSCDPRVRPMVLFVKHWAKVRGINSPYRGTLSSYGYVMMVLHYLINVVQPFVCPNLQQLAPPLPPEVPSQQLEDIAFCKGRNVQFWRDDQEIQRLAAMGMINQNRDSIGHLLRGFFEYYAQNGSLSTLPGRGFDWGRDVISLRTPGGILSKQKKGWTGAKTVLEVKPGVPSTAAAPSAQQPQQPVLPNADAPGMPSLPTGAPVPTMAPPPGLAPPPGFPAQPQGQMTGPVPPPPAPPAPTTEQPKQEVELKEVRYRYLFAIEDPFELEHNVARTVTHSGIVAIRDEFRRAWRIIRSAERPQQVQQVQQGHGRQGHRAHGQDFQGQGQQGHYGQGHQTEGGEMPVVQEEENLLEDVLESGKKKQREQFDEVLDWLHGKVWRGSEGVITSSDAPGAL